MNDQQFNKYQKLVLIGEDTSENIDKIAKPISGIPKSATDWLTDNAKRIDGWKQKPLFWQENESFMPDIPTE